MTTRFSFHCSLPIHLEILVENDLMQHVKISQSKDDLLTGIILDDDDNVSVNILHWLEMYTQKKKPKKQLPFSLDNTPPFNLMVLHEMLNIPFGKTKTYQEMAILTNRPKAARAVGNACGRNPFPLFIPCHRILAAGNKLGGYTSGLKVKELLLEFEGASVA